MDALLNIRRDDTLRLLVHHLLSKSGNLRHINHYSANLRVRLDERLSECAGRSAEINESADPGGVELGEDVGCRDPSDRVHSTHKPANAIRAVIDVIKDAVARRDRRSGGRCCGMVVEIAKGFVPARMACHHGRLEIRPELVEDIVRVGDVAGQGFGGGGGEVSPGEGSQNEELRIARVTSASSVVRVTRDF
ncbi:hypothetical protein BC937DRAFT_94548 [Endogone sp. FLAS-F59071]|nr:hypothetical protein BC937DRAFT_94548 [Endogone sp. FLAS-F59071]|eukprot:RUS20715.1 hypothetical protein BC937DRAFT_94548 [Endogone sp. FLAS-F59071]